MSFGLHFTWQMTAGRCHTLLSPVTEESGEEGTNSEISSPPACRSPSPVANTDASVNQDIAYYQALSAERLQTDAAKIHPSTSASQELYEPGLEPSATAKLGDLQRSWETLKNVVSLQGGLVFAHQTPVNLAIVL